MGLPCQICDSKNDLAYCGVTIITESKSLITFSTGESGPGSNICGADCGEGGEVCQHHETARTTGHQFDKCKVLL